MLRGKRPNPMHRVFCYGVAIFTVAIAFSLKQLLNPLLPPESLFLLFFAAIFVSASVGGFGAGLLATLLATLGIDYLLSPDALFQVNGGQLLQLLLFGLEGLLISGAIARLTNQIDLRVFQESQQRLNERRQVEEALRLSAERFRIALQNSPIAVFNQDQDLRYTWMHNSQLGHDPASVIGKTDFELMNAEDADQLSQIKNRVMQSGVGERQAVRASIAGEFSYFDLTVEPLRDEAGRIIGITAAAIDISERKRTEAELRIRAQQQAAIANLGQRALSGIPLRDLMHEAVDLVAHTLGVPYCKILELQPDGDNLLMRAAAGWDRTLIGRAMVPADLSTHAGYTLTKREPVIIKDLRQETRFIHSELLHQQGMISGMSVTITGQPQPYGILSTHTTEPHEFTQDDVNFLQAIANILAEAIQRQQVRETLQQQSTALAQANRLKDEFLATISHELRTPLNSLLGWSTLLPNRQFDLNTTNRAIEVITRNTQSLAQLIEDVLDMSDIIRGQLDLEVVEVDLRLVIEQAIAAIHLAAQAKNIRIQSNLDICVGSVLGDAARLQQIVWNLLSNAVKFTPRGGEVNVHLTTTSLLSSTPDAFTSHYAQISVTDTGKGISPDFLPFVFDRFRQEDSSTTRIHGGLGLGLAIVRYLVELHGGSIRAESQGIGQGATFVVSLPLQNYLP